MFNPMNLFRSTAPATGSPLLRAARGEVVRRPTVRSGASVAARATTVSRPTTAAPRSATRSAQAAPRVKYPTRNTATASEEWTFNPVNGMPIAPGCVLDCWGDPPGMDGEDGISVF